jgi:hypothetical protein
MKVGMQAFTTSECDLCFTPSTYPSSVVDKICLGCAEKRDLCAHCGDDLKAIEKQVSVLCNEIII